MTDDMDARARVKRLEAECERLRDMLNRIASGPRRDSVTQCQMAAEALAAPPPEGDLCDVCGGEGRRAFPNANNTMVHYPFCTACKGTGKVPHTPEQAERYSLDSEGRCLKCGGTGRIGVDSTREPCPACTSTAPEQASTMDHGGIGQVGCEDSDGILHVHAEDETCGVCQARGDALAALNWLTKNAGRHVDEQSADSQRAIVLDELTASGVPYVPEEVRRLPERWRDSAWKLVGNNSGVAYDEQNNEVNERSRLMECANELEQYLASAPEVCEWTPDDDGIYESACGESWLSLEDIPPEEMQMLNYCHGCGRRIRIAAAPTDGRE